VSERRATPGAADRMATRPAPPIWLSTLRTTAALARWRPNLWCAPGADSSLEEARPGRRHRGTLLDSEVRRPARLTLS